MLLERVLALAGSRKEDERQLAVQMVANYGRVGPVTARSPCAATANAARTSSRSVSNATAFLRVLGSLANNERIALLTRVSALSAIARLADVQLEQVFEYTCNKATMFILKVV